MLELFNRYMLYIFVLFGMLLGVPVVWYFRERAGTRRAGAVLLCVFYSVSSVIAAMLFAQLEALIGQGEAANGGAVSTYGIYFIAPLMLLLFAKLLKMNIGGVLDIYALYAMPSMFMMRVNCLIADCCKGLPMWDSGYHWPTRESELVFYTVMFLILWRLLKKNKVPGQLFPLLMTCYGCFRFINQWFRDTGSEGFHMAHGWSLLCAVIGLSLLLQLQAQNSKANTNKKRKK